MKHLIAGLVASIAYAAHANPVWITVGDDAAIVGQKSFSSVEKMGSKDGISILKVDSSKLPELGGLIHETFKRCSGYIVHESEQEAHEAIANSQDRAAAKSLTFADYSINQQDTVNALIAQVSHANIAETVRKLSSFHNRFYKAQTGVQSQQWLKEKWESLAQGRSDVKVEFFQHSSWPQPSLVMTIAGAQGDGGETIVIGGHADSISGMFGGANSRAPGADDNASGIATITEIIRVLMQNSYAPEKTLKFMGYAAEEVGLLGSKEIAQKFKRDQVNVVGALQLDMTNFKGSDQDIVLMSDYTNQAQNGFLGKLIDTYLKLKWGQDQCGYACSDHASWHQAGYPASIPFEARMREMNNQIHTSNDTIARSGDNAEHAAKFAKLGLSFLVELDR